RPPWQRRRARRWTRDGSMPPGRTAGLPGRWVGLSPPRFSLRSARSIFVILRISVMCVFMAMAACGTRPPLVSNSGLTVVGFDALPPPTRLDAQGNQRPYLIGANDRLSINVFGVEELSMTVNADAAGQISFPLIGTVEAAGHTPQEVGGLIQERLRP